MEEIRVDKYKLTPEGLRVARVLAEEKDRLTLGEGFSLATKGKGIPQYVLACICVAVCFPLGICWGLIKRL